MANNQVLQIQDLFNMAEEAIDEFHLPPPAVPWMRDNFIDPISKKFVRLMPYQRRVLREALQYDGEGYSKYSLIVWSQTKKSGKTAVAGGVGAWIANCVEQPNEVACVANDQEQSAGRIFAAMKPTLERLNWNVSSSPKGTFAYAPNGSIVNAITTNYKGEAGGNQGVSLWSELWAYSGERLNRLWEEMTPPPTRKFRMRWVETYAGYRQESLLLYSLYRRMFAGPKGDEESELQPGVVKIWDDLPVFVLEDANMLVFWDHDHRMPWQTADYYADQFSQPGMRPNAYARLHQNRWMDAAEQFITSELWENSCRRQGPLTVKSTYAIDGSKNGACTSMVGCTKIGSVVHTSDVYIWEPVDGQDIDQNEIMREVLGLRDKGLLQPPLYYDPYQLVKLAQDLRLKGLDCVEFPQGSDRVKSDTFLYKLYKEGNIVNWQHPGLRNHALAASAKKVGTDKEEYRIVKPDEIGGVVNPKQSMRFVDALVAQSMAAYKAYTAPTGGWARSGL